MGAPNQRCGFCGCAIGRSGNTDWGPVTMFNGTACCSQCASRERDKAKRASSSRGGSSGGGAAVGAVGGAALGVGLGIAGGVTRGIGKGLVGLGKLYYKGGKLAVWKTAEYNAKLAAEAQEILDMEIPQDETEFLTMFTELISQFETLPLKSKKGKAYNAKLNQMLRMLQVQNIEKYNQLLHMYQQAEEKSRKKKTILAKIIMGYGIIWGIMILIAIIVLVVFKDEIFKDEASGMLQKQAIEAIA